MYCSYIFRFINLNAGEFLELTQVDTDSDFSQASSPTTQKSPVRKEAFIFPQDDVPDYNTPPAITRGREFIFASGKTCPLTACEWSSRAFKTGKALQDHWNRCHLSKSLKVVCNLCSFHVFHRDQMNRHLRMVHGEVQVASPEDLSNLWWCICLRDRFRDPQGWYLISVDHLLGSCNCRAAMTPVHTPKSTSLYVTPPTYLLPAKRARWENSPERTIAQSVMAAARDVAGDADPRTLFLYPVHPSECLAQMTSSECKYPTCFQGACSTYMNTFLGDASAGNAQQVIRDWPEMPPQGKWPANSNADGVAAAAQHHASNLMLEWHLSLGGLHHLENWFMLNMLFMSAALQEMQSQLAASRQEVSHLKDELEAHQKTNED